MLPVTMRCRLGEADEEKALAAVGVLVKVDGRGSVLVVFESRSFLLSSEGAPSPCMLPRSLG